MKKVIVVSGTKDGRNIIDRLLESGFYVTAAVATDLGQAYLPESKTLKIVSGRLGRSGFESLIINEAAYAVVDASHPYARDVSVSVMEACEAVSVPYIRFERQEADVCRNTERVPDYEAALSLINKINGNILLTTGVNHLEVFTHTYDYENRIYLRILPVAGSIEKCRAYGFKARNLFAVQGPFSEEMNIAFMKHAGASAMVSKESGETGGFYEKQSACEKLNARFIVINRPQIVYRNKVSSIDEVIYFLKD